MALEQLGLLAHQPVNRPCSKYATFIPVLDKFNVKDVARLFFKFVIKYWGIPPSIKSEAIGASSFEITIGRQPLTRHTVATSYGGRSPSVYKFVKGWQEKTEITKEYLSKASKKMKKWADILRRHVKFKKGDLVMVKLLPHLQRDYGKVHKDLLRRYEGPFLIEKRIGKVTYRVNLPDHIESHLVFHVSMLKPFHKNEGKPSRGVCQRAPAAIGRSYANQVKEIVSHRVVPMRGNHPSYKEYLVHWKRLSDAEATWETTQSNELNN
ncbi:uncharacterized protein LOC110611591 [Manihot esculenta]|uniref:uncharacterized protein LOC110611591 n=1 Tax=Manihot esculenta TaxID=3983 RepID=UPI000B5D511D|nr:uncharacterized protein LOC110611591 [Manihot esculenta]